ncbi:MAG: GTPase Era [Gammaproteobacteria bacterium]|nr:GTPase Era [Gammaproteobacteria bacterium]
MNEKKSYCGYVAIVGRPNVGKSTLLNALIGQKISIISRKPQTTRHQIAGIKTIDAVQIIFIDTPGLHSDQNKRAMNRYMNRLATSVMSDADVILFLVEAQRWQEEDELILRKISQANVPVILVVNKLDILKDKKHVLPVIDLLKEKYDFAAIIPLSAKNHDNLDVLENTLIERMPEGPHLFPDEQVTDRQDSFRIAEIIREKIIHTTGQELPYSTAVVIESMESDDNKVNINAIIWVEREGQKPIIIGANGERLKKIGTAARKEIVRLLGQKVFLRLWVKVKSNWTDDAAALGGLGYE